MTEADWLTGTDPTLLLTFADPRLSERQRLLFCVACCRRIWYALTDEQLRHLVDRAEDCAEGRITREELQQDYDAPIRPGQRHQPPQEILTTPWSPGEADPVPFRTFHIGSANPPLRIGLGTVNFNELPAWCRQAFWAGLAAGSANAWGAANHAASTAAEYAAEQTREAHPNHERIGQLRDAVVRAVRQLEDHQFRGIDRLLEEKAAEVQRLETGTNAEIGRLEAEIASSAGEMWKHVNVPERAAQADLVRCVCGNPFYDGTFDPAWCTSTVMGLAEAVYAGHFDRVPILADALEEAGCADARILAHCRAAAALHARGCWVVDRVLGKMGPAIISTPPV